MPSFSYTPTSLILPGAIFKISNARKAISRITHTKFVGCISGQLSARLRDSKVGWSRTPAPFAGGPSATICVILRTLLRTLMVQLPEIENEDSEAGSVSLV